MARLPFIGYVGPDFRPGGFVLMAINPGGGNFDRRTAEDNRLCPALHRLQNASTQETRGAFADLVQVYLDVVPTWNLWRIFSPSVSDQGRCVAAGSCAARLLAKDRVSSTGCTGPIANHRAREEGGERNRSLWIN